MQLRKILPLLLFVLAAGAQQQSSVSDYALALTGELAACQKYAADCEARQREFALRCQERERAAEREVARLKAELKRLREQRQALLQGRQAMEAECSAREIALQALDAPLSEAEQRLESQKALLPEELRDGLLPPFKGDDLPARINRHLENVSAIENFSSHAQRPFSRRMQEREYQVLPCGLSLALAYSAGDGSAGIGVRREDGWHWIWDRRWYRQIKRAAEICSGARPPELLELPLLDVIGKGGGQ
jgi:hypothetical protein